MADDHNLPSVTLQRSLTIPPDSGLFMAGRRPEHGEDDAMDSGNDELRARHEEGETAMFDGAGGV